VSGQHDINCHCEACRFLFAEADDFAAKLFKSLHRCRREGCQHNNCLFDREGKCAGACRV